MYIRHYTLFNSVPEAEKVVKYKLHQQLFSNYSVLYKGDLLKENQP